MRGLLLPDQGSDLRPQWGVWSAKHWSQTIQVLALPRFTPGSPEAVLGLRSLDRQRETPPPPQTVLLPEGRWLWCQGDGSL